MIENIEGVFRFVAEKFNIIDVFNVNTGFYRITDKSVQFSSGVACENIESIAQEQIQLGNISGFYLDTTHLSIKEFNAGIGLHERFLPFNDEDPNDLAEVIALHELAHLIEQQKLVKELGIELTECDNAIGVKIEEHISLWYPDLVHNKEFVAILNYLIRLVYPINLAHKLRIALSLTLVDIENGILNDEVDETFYNCNDIN